MRFTREFLAERGDFIRECFRLGAHPRDIQDVLKRKTGYSMNQNNINSLWVGTAPVALRGWRTFAKEYQFKFTPTKAKASKRAQIIIANQHQLPEQTKLTLQDAVKLVPGSLLSTVTPPAQSDLESLKSEVAALKETLAAQGRELMQVKGVPDSQNAPAQPSNITIVGWVVSIEAASLKASSWDIKPKWRIRSDDEFYYIGTIPKSIQASVNNLYDLVGAKIELVAQTVKPGRSANIRSYLLPRRPEASRGLEMPNRSQDTIPYDLRPF